MIFRYAALAVCLTVVFALAPVQAADPELTFRNISVPVPKMAHPPTLDGVIGDDEWAGAGITPRLIEYDRQDRLSDGIARFYFGYDDQNLYVAWQLQRPPGALAPKAVIATPDTAFFRTDDAIEFMINCIGATKNKARGRDYYMIWNAINTRYDRSDWSHARGEGVLDWTGDWKTVSNPNSTLGWEGEAVFPLEILKEADKPELGQHWFFQILENRATPQPRVALLGYQIGWQEAFDYPTMLFTGDTGVFARVLGSGAMPAEGRAGLKLELVNPSSTARTVVPTVRLYKRKADAATDQTYLRMFDQSRDRDVDLKGEGKVITGLTDAQLSQQIISESYDLLRETNNRVQLVGGERTIVDMTFPSAAGDYLIIYDVRYAPGDAPDGARELIAGGPLPFAIPESLGLTLNPFYLVDKSIEVTADLRYVPGWAAKGAVEATLSSVDDASQVHVQKQIDANGVYSWLEFDLSIANCSPGDYQLTVRAMNETGQELYSRVVDVTIPSVPDWYTNKVGMSPIVPMPWTPIAVSEGGDDTTVSTLTGEYTFEDSMLPQSARVRSIFTEQREPVLRAPMTLTGVVDGHSVEWRGNAATIGEQRDEVVSITSTAAAGGVTIHAASQVEFDGMVKVTLDIEPSADASPSITDLTLSIPITKQLSDLMRANIALVRPDKVQVRAGSIPAGGVQFDWRPNVWLGNNRRGIEWFAENWRGWRWSASRESQVIEIENSNEGATLRIHMVSMDPRQPLVLDKPRRIVFGYMLTPARTINPRAVRHGYSYYEDNTKYGGLIEAEKEAGVNTVEVWNHRPLQGWPDQTPQRSVELRKLGDRMHDAGIRVTPYTAWFLSRKSQVYPTWGAEMVVQPRIYGGFSCEVCCWNSPVNEAFVHQLVKASIESGYDGFRTDAGWSASPCSSLKHRGYGSVCGWHDDHGRLQASVPLFAAREGAKRAYRAYKGGEVTEDGLPLHHIHRAIRIGPIMSFMDGVVSAEGAERHAMNMTEFDLSHWRAFIMGDQWGHQVIYGPKTDTLGYNSRLAVGLLHRLTPRGSAFVSRKEQAYSRATWSVSSVWKAEDWVQWLDDGTEFYGYWENASYLDTGAADLYGSFHVRRGEKLLLALFNRELKPVERTTRIKLADLGFEQSIYALDAVTRERVEVHDGAVTLTYKPESYRLIQFASEPFDVIQPEKTGPNLIAEVEPTQWPAQGLPEGWKHYGDISRFTATGSELKITAVGGTTQQLSRLVALQPGRRYLLEVEARVDCDNGTYLGVSASGDKFEAMFGEHTNKPRTIGSQMLPGLFETLRVHYTTDADTTNVPVRLMLNGDGAVTIRKIGVYEVAK